MFPLFAHLHGWKRFAGGAPGSVNPQISTFPLHTMSPLASQLFQKSPVAALCSSQGSQTQPGQLRAPFLFGLESLRFRKKPWFNFLQHCVYLCSLNTTQRQRTCKIYLFIYGVMSLWEDANTAPELIQDNSSWSFCCCSSPHGLVQSLEEFNYV